MSMDERTSSVRRKRAMIVVLAGLAVLPFALVVIRSSPFGPWRPGTTHIGSISTAGCSIFYPDDADRAVTTSDPATLGWSSVDHPPDNWTTVKRVSGALTLTDDTDGPRSGS